MPGASRSELSRWLDRTALRADPAVTSLQGRCGPLAATWQLLLDRGPIVDWRRVGLTPTATTGQD